MNTAVAVMKEKVLEYVSRYHDENGFSPTYREVGRAVGLSSTSTVSHYIKTLENEGKLVLRPQKARTLSFPCGAEKEDPEEVQRVCLRTADGGELCFDCAIFSRGGKIELSFSGILDATGLRQRVSRVVCSTVEEAN